MNMRAAVLFVVRCTAIVLTFLSHLLFARLMGVEQYGYFAYVWTWATMLALPALLGLDTSALRFVPSYLNQRAWGLLNGFYSRTRQLVLTSACMTALVTLVVVHLSTRLEPDVKLTFTVVSVILPLLAIVQVRASWLHAFGEVVRAQLIVPVFRPLMVIAVVLVIVYTTDIALTAPIATLIHLPVLAILLMYTAARLQRLYPTEAREITPEFRTKAWIRVSGSLVLMSSLQILLTKTDIAMLGVLQTTTDAGIYSIATQIAALVLMGNLASTALVSPHITALHEAGDHEALQQLIDKAARINLAVSVPVAGVFYLFGGTALTMFGADFSVGYYSLIVLVSAQLFVALAGPVGAVMAFTGHEREATKIIGGCTLLNVILNAALIPLLGLVGAALATGVSLIVRSALLARAVQRRLRLVAHPFRRPSATLPPT